MESEICVRHGECADDEAEDERKGKKKVMDGPAVKFRMKSRGDENETRKQTQKSENAGIYSVGGKWGPIRNAFFLGKKKKKNECNENVEERESHESTTANEKNCAK